MGVINPFTLNIITDKAAFMSVILLFVFSIYLMAFSFLYSSITVSFYVRYFLVYYFNAFAIYFTMYI